MQRSSRIRLPLLAAAMLVAGCGYNQIQTMDEQVNQAQGQIQTQLQRRADLIPNLVNTVKGVTKQEDTVFISIANARARLGGAVQSGNVPSTVEYLLLTMKYIFLFDFFIYEFHLI